MKTLEPSKFKEKQDQYFSVEQPHLKSTVDHYTLKMAKRLALQANLNPQDTILEIGCGAGRFTIPLLSLGLKIHGLDLSKKLLKDLENLKQKNLVLLEGDLDEIGQLTKVKFNKLIGFFILHHLPQLERSLKSLKKVSQKNSLISFVEPNPLNPMFYPQPFIYKNMSWREEKGFIKLTPSFIKKSFEKAGFEDIKIINFGFLPPFIVSRGPGIYFDNFLEKLPLKTFLPFQLITAKVN